MRGYAVILLVAVATLVAGGRAHGTIEIVASTGDSAPGESGNFLSFPLPPVINSSGQVAFLGDLSNTMEGPADDSGLFRGTPATLIPIAREGDTAPGGDGVIGQLDDFASFSLNDLGDVSFVNFLTDASGGEENDEMILRGNGQMLTAIAREGQTIPDGSSRFDTFFAISGAVLNGNGQVAFQGVLEMATATSANDSGFWRGNGTSLTQIVRESDPAPSDNRSFGENILSEMAINDLGQVGFTAFTGQADDFFASRRHGVFRGSGTALTELVRAGDASPDGDGRFVVHGTAFGDPALLNSGQAVFTARLTETDGGATDDTGIYRGDESALVQLAREGQAAPDRFGSNGVFNILHTPALNGIGDVAFAASLAGTSGGNLDNSGIFFADGTTLRPVVREGQPAPSDVFTDGTFAHFSGSNKLAVNLAGQIAFSADLVGTSDGRLNDVGIFLFDPNRGLMQVVREGDMLLNSSIASLDFAGGIGNKAAARNGLNDTGQVTFKFTLINGDQGIALFTPMFEALAGDYNNDGVVDAADYTVWRENVGTSVNLPNDPLGNTIGRQHYDQWKANYGLAAGSGALLTAHLESVPEPTSCCLTLAALAALGARKSRRASWHGILPSPGMSAA